MEIAQSTSVVRMTLRGLLDAAVGASAAWMVGFAIILTSSPAAAPYRWLDAHIGTFAVPVVFVAAPLLLPLGFLFSLLKLRFGSALATIVAALLLRQALHMSSRSRGAGRPDAIPLIVLISLASVWFVARLRG